jgi:hypothetical protein
LSDGIHSTKSRAVSRRSVLFRALPGLVATSALYALDSSAWRAYEAVEESWIRDRHELLVQEAPGAPDAAALDLEVRLADLRKRAIEFRFLTSRDTALLHGGIWQMASLPVTPALQRELQSNPEYRKAQETVRTLTEHLQKHPQFAVLQRAQMRLWKTPRYREIHRRYTGKMQDLQRLYGGSPAPSLSFADDQ